MNRSQLSGFVVPSADSVSESDTALSVESAFLVHVSQSSVRVSMDMARICSCKPACLDVSPRETPVLLSELERVLSNLISDLKSDEITR